MMAKVLLCEIKIGKNNFLCKKNSSNTFFQPFPTLKDVSTLKLLYIHKSYRAILIFNVI